MPCSPVGQSVFSVDTPALLLDLDALDSNINRMAQHITSRGKHWRPHAKAFKTPALAHRLIRAGAIGITVAKLSEAEVYAACGIQDILIAHLIVDPRKAARLAALQQCASVKATVDNPSALPTLSSAATAAGVTIDLLVDVDIGMGRTGVPTAEAALTLAQQIHESPGLRCAGVMGYEGHTLAIADPNAKRAAITQAINQLARAASRLEADGLACPIVSAGGSGSYQYTADLPIVTELQAGGGIFCCMYYSSICGVSGHQPALHILAQVVSTPAPDRVVLDAGRKTLNDHLISPCIVDYPESQFISLSAEHATVRVSAHHAPVLGEKLLIIPGYSDLTFVLHNQVIAHRLGRVQAVWPLWARGQLE